jgi:hypothetical protein
MSEELIISRDSKVRNKIHQNANHKAHQVWEVSSMCIDDEEII